VARFGIPRTHVSVSEAAVQRGGKRFPTKIIVQLVLATACCCCSMHACVMLAVLSVAMNATSKQFKRGEVEQFLLIVCALMGKQPPRRHERSAREAGTWMGEEEEEL